MRSFWNLSMIFWKRCLLMFWETSYPIASFLYNQSLRSHQSCLHPDHMSDAVDLILWRWCQQFLEGETILFCTTIMWQFLSHFVTQVSYTLTCKYANTQSWVRSGYISYILPFKLYFLISPVSSVCTLGDVVLLIWRMGEEKDVIFLEYYKCPC